MTRTASRVAVVVVWCALVAVAAIQVPHLGFDNDTWLALDDPKRLELEDFRAEFEPDEAFLVVVELDDDFFAPQQIARIRRLDEALDALAETRSVLSPLSATTIVDTGKTLEIGSFGDALGDGFLADSAAYREKFLRSPYAGKLLSADQRKLLLRVAIERQTADSIIPRRRAVAAVAETVRSHGFTARFAGETALKYELNRATRDQLPWLLVMAAALLAVFLRVACGNWARASVIFMAAIAAVTACLGILAAFNWPMNAILLVLPVMVAVIAIADGLHILACWDGLADLDPTPRLRETIRQSWLPCLGATITSAVGFGAFMVSELVPLNHFGKASALAISYAYPLIIGALWGGLWLFPPLTETPAQRLPSSLLTGRLSKKRRAYTPKHLAGDFSEPSAEPLLAAVARLPVTLLWKSATTANSATPIGGASISAVRAQNPKWKWI